LPSRRYDTILRAKPFTSSRNSIEIAYYEIIISKRFTGEMGYIALTIWDAIPVTESYKRLRGDRFLG